MSTHNASYILRFLVAPLALLAAALLPHKPVRAQVIDIVSIDLSGIPMGTPLSIQLGIRDSFFMAERFWESRLIGFSAQLPTLLQRQVRPVRITAAIASIDGAGGVLGFAGPTTLRSYTGSKPYAIPDTAFMQFDSDDVVLFQQLGLFDDIVRHEMAHALGFGSLWTDNRLNLGPLGHYTGAFALKQFRTEARKPNAFFVPVEQLGGGGTAGAHWDSAEPFFYDPDRNAGDVMLGFITDAPTVSETTWAAFADLWYKVKGVNDSLPGTRPGTGRGPRISPIN